MTAKLLNEEEAERAFWKDMSDEDERTYLAEKIRLEIINKLSQFRTEQGLRQAELARRTQTTGPMLSRFFKGTDERSPTLDTLVKLAWGLNKQIKVDFIDLYQDQVEQKLSSALPSLTVFRFGRSFMNWDEPSAVLEYARPGSVCLKRFDVDVGANPEAEQKMFFLATERYVEHVWVGDESSRTLRMQLTLSSRAHANVGSASFLIKAALDVDYQLKRNVPVDVARKIPETLTQHCVVRALPLYDDMVRCVARNMGIGLSTKEIE